MKRQKALVLGAFGAGKEVDNTQRFLGINLKGIRNTTTENIGTFGIFSPVQFWSDTDA